MSCSSIATLRRARKSTSAEVVRFDVVKAKNQFAVDAALKHFYQAEVLVPSSVPPHLIRFPDPNAKVRVKASRPTKRPEQSLLPCSKIPCPNALGCPNAPLSVLLTVASVSSETMPLKLCEGTSAQMLTLPKRDLPQ